MCLKARVGQYSTNLMRSICVSQKQNKQMDNYLCTSCRTTSRPKDQSKSFAKSETSSDPMTTRSAKHASGKPMQTNPDKQASGSPGSAHTEDETDREDPTQGIPDWLQPFTANLKDLEMHVPAHSSDSSERGCFKRRDKKNGSTVSIFTSSTDRNCDMCLRTKITKVLCRRRDEGSIPRAEKFGDLITADRVQLFVPKEESFPIPLKYIDVIRSIHTDLDVAQEKRIDDYWNVDGNRNLSDSWTGFTSLNETPPRGFMWSGERLTTIQTTSRPDHIRPDAWIRVVSAAKRN